MVTQTTDWDSRTIPDATMCDKGECQSLWKPLSDDALVIERSQIPTALDKTFNASATCQLSENQILLSAIIFYLNTTG